MNYQSLYMIFRKIALVAFFSGMSIFIFAQDTTRTINITSTFKPELREPAKIIFNAQPAQRDSLRPVLNYNIPALNLNFAYEAAELKPSALKTDTGDVWSQSNFIKVGAGNVYLPFVQAGMSFGDGTNAYFNVFASHFSAKGDLPFQKSSQTSVGGMASYKNLRNQEWTGFLGFSSDNYNLYGFRPDSLQFDKKDLKQNFTTFDASLSLKNITETKTGFDYHPVLKISYFTDNHNNSTTETNVSLKAPVTKMFGDNWGVKLTALADLTNYRLTAPEADFANNIFAITPAVVFRNENLNLHAGLTPSSDQNEFHLLPEITADFTTNDQRFTVQAGLIGYYNKGSYQRFAGFNPFLFRPDSLLNDRVQEGYFGFKGSAGSNFTYSAKMGFQMHKNIALFNNDTIDGKQFNVYYEPKLNIFQTHVEAAYQRGESFLAKASFNWNNFIKIEKEASPWGLLPIELDASLRVKAGEGIWLKSGLWAFHGAKFFNKNGDEFRGQSGLDLHLGGEVKITGNLNVWLTIDNLLNNKYERWNHYKTYGFNILGGIVYKFDN